jgi:hypothetical protein
MVKNFLDVFLRPHSKKAFIGKLDSTASVLDIGCGNDSDKIFKQLLPEAHYVGVDIHEAPIGYLGNEYVLSNSERFNVDVSGALRKVDVVISAHNLEHCNNYEELVEILAEAENVKKIFLSFPSSVSLNLPVSKYGTLNFYQDPTHNKLPNLFFILDKLKKKGWNIDFYSNSYKPLIPYLIGLLWMPVFKLTSIESPLFGTYSFYGFETVVWASRS